MHGAEPLGIVAVRSTATAAALSRSQCTGRGFGFFRGEFLSELWGGVPTLMGIRGVHGVGMQQLVFTLAQLRRA